ncbi:MAG: hypothetical protein CMI29_09025 [Opitutae bacterium]|nr:hypothetical protein [Opitutae bacterium]|tara:strand:- start:8799 stop:10418 length:1620 start_codon:yes stop_codon:yes gene_type:complete
MAILPVRDLGKDGAITDLSPYNLPLSAFSRAVNVRFDEGKVRRSPVFRTVLSSIGYNPRFTFGIVPSSGFDTALVVSDDYVIKEYANGALTDRSGSISASSDPRPFTGTTLSDVVYINRPDRVPVFRDPAGTNFADLTNWPSTYRAVSIRSFGSQLIALNITQGGTSFPNRVRFSNFALANSVPDSWDETDTTKSAGFNDLVEMDTAIVDGLSLGSNFIIYSSTEVFLQEFVGGSFLFNFRKLFTDSGLINQNCVVEVEGKHYCFDNADIYVHDGTTRKSICDERVKNFIFQGLNALKKNRCFVHHDPNLNEIYFCYVSGDELVGFPNADRCNRAAVYNYRKNTWSFVDLPNVSSATVMNLNTVTTYAGSTGLPYDTTGGSYYDQEDSFNRHVVFVGEDLAADGITSDKIYGLDLSDEGSIAFPLDTEATKGAVFERVGIDLDQASRGVGVRGYKVLTRIYPQAQTNNTNKLLTLEFGASDTPSTAPTFSAPVSYNTETDHKIDSRAAGRYLSYRVSIPDTKDFEFSGFDFEVTATGRR